MNNHALIQLLLARIRIFVREPEAIFWTYGFPLIMTVVLGIAFRNRPESAVEFDVVDGPAAVRVQVALGENARFEIHPNAPAAAFERLRKNKTPLVVGLAAGGDYEYHYDPTNPEGRLARAAVDEALQRAAGRVDPLTTTDVEVSAPGSRYIDFLVPGLIGMNLMGGGIWGIGFVVVDMRVKHLLKRLLATPMRRHEFLASILGIRMVFFIPEMGVLLLAAYLLFGVPIYGNLLTLVLVAFIGTFAFAGLGVLIACRASRIETVTGLMNVAMLPMWLLSGVFFSSDRFPDFLQPLIRALPLTQLNDALRALMLEGAPLFSQWVPVLILLLWGTVCFTLGLRWFKWRE